MPELPEVETIARGLRRALVGRRIERLSIQRDDQLRPSRAAFERLPGLGVTGVDRYGKHLFIELDDGRTLAVHLRMTGQLRIHAPADEELPHTHLVFGLDDGRQLRWRDVRRFGWLHLIETAAVGELPSLRGLGPDALAVGEAEFVARLGAVRRAMKPLLLAQDVVCGLGNIYADEVLWRARIHPLQRSDRLSRPRARRLYAAMRETLEQAIAAGGSSIDGEYVDAGGAPGAYQAEHAVYGRAGQPAPCCGRPVKRLVINARSTCYCPRCQKKVGA